MSLRLVKFYFCYSKLKIPRKYQGSFTFKVGAIPFWSTSYMFFLRATCVMYGKRSHFCNSHVRMQVVSETDNLKQEGRRKTD